MTGADSEREELARLVRELGVVHGRVTLASGAEADYYVDLRRVTLHHRAAPLVGRLMRVLTADWDYARRRRSHPGCGPGGRRRAARRRRRARGRPRHVTRRRLRGAQVDEGARDAAADRGPGRRRPPGARRRGHVDDRGLGADRRAGGARGRGDGRRRGHGRRPRHGRPGGDRGRGRAVPLAARPRRPRPGLPTDERKRRSQGLSLPTPLSLRSDRRSGAGRRSVAGGCRRLLGCRLGCRRNRGSAAAPTPAGCCTAPSWSGVCAPAAACSAWACLAASAWASASRSTRRRGRDGVLAAALSAP